MRVGDVPVGAVFHTRLTKLDGMVLDSKSPAGVVVIWGESKKTQAIHPDIQVDVEEKE